MLPIIIKICIFSKTLKSKKKVYLKSEKCGFPIFPLLCNPLQGQDAALCSDIKPSSFFHRTAGDILTEDLDNSVKTKNKERTSHLILLASVSSSIKWDMHIHFFFSSQGYYEH